MKITSGVYKILNIINTKVYIGSSYDTLGRWKEHFSNLKKGNHSNKHLQKAFYKYGEENFKFEVIETCPNKKAILIEKEQYWMDFYQSYNPKYGYNMSRVAGSPMKDRKHTDESKQKMSLSNIGKLVGYKHTDKTRLNMSLAHIGVPSPLKGIPLSEETKQKLSLALTGRKQSDLWEEYLYSIKKRIDKSPISFNPYTKFLQEVYALTNLAKFLIENRSEWEWVECNKLQEVMPFSCGLCIYLHDCKKGKIQHPAARYLDSLKEEK